MARAGPANRPGVNQIYPPLAQKEQKPDSKYALARPADRQTGRPADRQTAFVLRGVPFLSQRWTAFDGFLELLRRR